MLKSVRNSIIFHWKFVLLKTMLYFCKSFQRKQYSDNRRNYYNFENWHSTSTLYIYRVMKVKERDEKKYGISISNLVACDDELRSG